MGWLFIMFDLPTDTAEERRLSSRFRENLLDDGYLMLQYSVYVRSGVTLDRKNRYIENLKRINPKTGSIKCLFITDTQWGQMITLEGKDHDNKRSISKNPKSYEQIQFW